MTLRQYLTLMTIGTVICWVTWILILFTIDPNQAGAMVFLFFYLSLFLALVGTFSVTVFLVRRAVVKDDEIVFRHVKRTFRQSVILAALIVLALFLLQKELLTWWNSILLLMFYLILEGIIFTNRKYSNQDYV